MRNRVPPPIITAGLCGVAFILSKYAPLRDILPSFRWIGGGVAFLGLIILLWAGVLFKRRKTTVNPFRPEKTSVIVAEGPYRFTRNPMYLGMLFLLIGLSLIFAHPANIILIVGFIVYMTQTQIKPEEDALTIQFGTDYTDYMAKVRRWV